MTENNNEYIQLSLFPISDFYQPSTVLHLRENQLNEISIFFGDEEHIKLNFPDGFELSIFKCRGELRVSFLINTEHSRPEFLDFIEEIIKSVLDAAKAWRVYQNNIQKKLKYFPYVEPDKLDNIDKEDFSYAYINLIASTARLTCQNLGRRMDNEGTDINILGAINDRLGIKRRHNLFAQVKCTSKAIKKNSHIIYRKLCVKNYEELRTSPDQFVLILVLVPNTMNELAYITRDLGSFFQCEAYWISLRDAPPTLNKDFITIKIPKSNFLNSYELQRIMCLSLEGEL